MMRLRSTTFVAFLQLSMRQMALLLLLAAIPTAAPAGIVQLPQTGQKTCYDQAGALIPCAGTRQDGELQTGLQPPVPTPAVQPMAASTLVYFVCTDAGRKMARALAV